MKTIKYLAAVFVFYFALSLMTACSPHPGTGVWMANTDNELGISKMIVAFDGRVEFNSSKPENAKWHCFWEKLNKNSLELDCTPSNHVDQPHKFHIISIDKLNAELRENEKLLARLKRLNENPVLPK